METVPGIKHPALRDAIALTRPAGRRDSGCYLAEDLHLVTQALDAPEAEVRSVFCIPAATDTLAATCAARKTPLYVVPPGLMAKLVGTGYETATTAVAVVRQRVVLPEDLAGPDALILCGQSIQDPRNVGVLIRTADALGCTGLLLSADSAEPFSRQAVRSTTGSILRLPVALSPDLPETVRALRARGVRAVASSGAAPVRARDVALEGRPLLIAVGNEQRGVTDALVAACDALVRLPMAPNTRADSLNVTVAAGMLLYEATR